MCVCLCGHVSHVNLRLESGNSCQPWTFVVDKSPTFALLLGLVGLGCVGLGLELALGLASGFLAWCLQMSAADWVSLLMSTVGMAYKIACVHMCVVFFSPVCETCHKTGICVETIHWHHQIRDETLCWYRMWRSVGKASAYATLVRQMPQRRRRPLPDHRGTAACWSGDGDCSSPCQVSHIMISISINWAHWCTSRSLETPRHTLMTCCSQSLT